MCLPIPSGQVRNSPTTSTARSALTLYILRCFTPRILQPPCHRTTRDEVWGIQTIVMNVMPTPDSDCQCVWQVINALLKAKSTRNEQTQSSGCKVSALIFKRQTHLSLQPSLGFTHSGPGGMRPCAADAPRLCSFPFCSLSLFPRSSRTNCITVRLGFVFSSASLLAFEDNAASEELLSLNPC